MLPETDQRLAQVPAEAWVIPTPNAPPRAPSSSQAQVRYDSLIPGSSDITLRMGLEETKWRLRLSIGRYHPGTWQNQTPGSLLRGVS